MRPLLITSGEPAGIGPDICLALAQLNLPVVVLADKNILVQRAEQLKLAINFYDYKPDSIIGLQNSLTVLSLPTKEKVVAGQLNCANASYIIEMLTTATKLTLSQEFSALVTAPIQKSVINQAGITFTGHTEFLAEHCHIQGMVVMMLVCEAMRVALVTTHLPLKAVPAVINVPLIIKIITQVHASFKQDFGIKNPCIYVAGLNPHAGEAGYLGREELDIIIPALTQLRQRHINVHGPFPADTLFTPEKLASADVFVTMYHDQGLPVLKYAGFGQAVNVSLGLPIIRTSVDHGTALTLAGSGHASADSLIAAIKLAQHMVICRAAYAKH